MKFDAKIISANGISAIVGGKPYNVGSDNANYDKILKSLKGKDATEFLKLVTSNKVDVKSSGFVSSESIVVGQYEVTYKGEPLHNTVTQRLIELQEEGHDVAPLAKFLENSLSLPSENLEALFQFMENKGLPITEDGCVLGWKVVDKNFRDKHTGRVDNTPGVTVTEIPRALCDSSRDVACSKGYHIGNLNYAGPQGHFYHPQNGDRIVICKFNPKNLVSVPADSSDDKIRVTVYDVLEEYKEMLPNTFVNLSLKDVKAGDRIVFTLTKDSRISKDYEVIMKYEGISQRSKNTKFYGRLLKGTEYGEPGRSASFLISEISNLKKVF